MKRAIIILVTVILIVLIGLVAVINYNSLSKNSDSKPFYVGVTFGGDTTAEAKLLIDKVKNYTNLFVLQSGTLQRNTTAMNEIGDYVISSNMNKDGESTFWEYIIMMSLVEKCLMLLLP
jgi:hypothetical protein